MYYNFTSPSVSSCGDTSSIAATYLTCLPTPDKSYPFSPFSHRECLGDDGIGDNCLDEARGSASYSQFILRLLFVGGVFGAVWVGCEVVS